MPTYVALLNWTEQGVRDFKDTTKRAEAAQAVAERLGGRFRDLLWTVGPYDLVCVAEAPDDETFAAIMLAISSAGNVRSTTLRAFSAEEMAGVIEKAG
jgi:uncharacterized protein with GYD domain